jgi:hypothetical protein
MLDDSTKAVAVGSDQNSLAFLELGHDDVVPVRQGAGDGQFQRFKLGEFLLGRTIGISGVVDNGVEVGVILFHCWRRGVKAATPDLNLRDDHKVN